MLTLKLRSFKADLTEIVIVCALELLHKLIFVVDALMCSQISLEE